jgi:hypothetical protein
MTAAQQPPAQPVASSTKWSLLRRFLSEGRSALLGLAAILAALVAIVTNWDTLRSALFPAKHAAEATIAARVDPDISLQEFDLQDRPPAQRPALTAEVAPGESPRPGSRYRFAAYTVPASAQPPAGGFVVVASNGQAKLAERKTTNTAEEKIKEEGEKVTEEAKHAEESAARERAEAAAEQKAAEAREREEQTKEQEAQKRAEETQKPGVAQAKAERAKAQKAVQKAKETVRTKKQEAVQPPSQRRIEAGMPLGRVEEVLHRAHVREGCRPTCALKPIVEKVLKATSNNAAAAASEVRAVTRGSGARVHFEVTLKGLEHKVVVLTYSLVQTNGAPPPAAYLDTVAIKTLAPAHEPEVVRGSCWVPVPSSSRHYYVVLTVYDGDTEVGYKETSAFQ